MNTKYLLTISFLIFSLNVFGQSKDDKKLKKAEQLFKTFSYADASKIYADLAKDSASELVITRLAECYYYLNEWEKSAEWLAKAVEIPKIDPKYILMYSHALKSINRVAESHQWMEIFNEQNSKDSRGINYVNNMGEYDKQVTGKINAQVSPVSFNSVESEFAPAYYKDSILVFTTSRKVKPEVISRTSTRNNKPFLDIVSVDLSDKNPKTKVFLSDLNSSYHDGPVSFNSDYTRMYITRNTTDKKGVSHLKLFSSNLEDGKWSELKPLPINADNYSVGHAVINPEGNKLYFVSDMPGGIGGTDIYQLDVDSLGNVSNLKNLGNNINTEGNEMFPFVDANGTLYFSSDGYMGLGRLDIFFAQEEDGTFGGVTNIGDPINSPFDDFGIILRKGNNDGMFCSNRPGGIGDDDIYNINFMGSFEKLAEDGTVVKGKESKNKIQYTLILKAEDEKSKALLPDTKIILINEDTGEKEEFITDAEGKAYKHFYKKEEDVVLFQVLVENRNYFQKADFTEVDMEEGKSKEFVSTIIQPEDGMDIAYFIDLDYIPFNPGKSEILPEAAKQLDRVVVVLKQFPQMIIELGAHTDSKGTSYANMALSYSRAQSSANYIIGKGVDAGRIRATGYGESKLKNRCKDGVNCNEEEHQLNRRIEFIILATGITK